MNSFMAKISHSRRPYFAKSFMFSYMCDNYTCISKVEFKTVMTAFLLNYSYDTFPFN